MRKELLKEILKLSQLQAEALKDEDVDALEVLVRKKQEIIDKINEINSQHYIELDSEETELIHEAKLIGDLNDKEFNRQYEEVKLNIKKIRDNKKADKLYVNPYDISAEEGIFFDKR